MLPPPRDPSAFITILIAEDNVVSREMMAAILQTQGYKTVGAGDGDEAIAYISQHDVDLALVDINMAPTGGFEFVKYLLVNGIDLPVVVVTADDSSDMLIESSALGVQRVLQKPIQPARLLETVSKILKRRGLNPQPMGVSSHETHFTHESLMARAIELANKNAQSKKGGPFGAVIANKEGKILGEGVNGITSRSDPTAHAEVMAIRQAAERLGRSDLSDCVLYISSEPTMMGKALILSVGIPKVYFGLSHEEVRQIRAREEVVREGLSGEAPRETAYEQMGHDAAAAMFLGWASLKDKVAD
jgi:tRNA(Arg) A34 adenosine deaminase TadA/CheY-like chemotaxis protein